MSSLSDRRIRRTISSQSLKRLPMKRVPSLATLVEAILVDEETDLEICDSEFFIDYSNVPRKILASDIFYSIIQFRFGILFLLVSAVMLFFVFIFAIIYKNISPSCGLNVESSLNEAWLFSLLVHFKTCLGPPVPPPTADSIPPGTFWNGCTGGVFALFGQLFVGNILMSILISSLVFNFQSISRRTQTRFSSITLSKAACIKKEEDSQFSININVTEIQQDTHLQASNVIGTIFSIHPPSKTVPPLSDHLFFSTNTFDNNPIKCIAHNIPVLITTPGIISGRIPSDLYSPVKEFPFCPICGRDGINCVEHPVKPVIETKEEVVLNLRNNKIQFLVIIEGSDPVTNDRIQLQKIYRNNLLDNQIGGNFIHFNKNRFSIDYSSFL